MKAKLAVILLCIAALAALPKAAGRHYTYVTAEALLLGLVAVSFNILFGYTGLLSFGHATFWGTGAYTVAVLMVKFSKPFPLALAASLLTSLAAALAIGYLSVRHTKIYFAMLTLAFGELFYAVAVKWRFLGGSDGIYGIPKPTGSLISYYYVVLAGVAASLAIMWWITQTPLGLTLRAVKDNPMRAEYIGISVKRARLASFVVSGVFAGVAGALYAPLAGAVSPEFFSWTKSAEIVFVTLFGGAVSFIGPTIGALIYDYMRHLAMGMTEHWMLIVGSLLVATVLLFPQGVVGAAQAAWRKVRR
ncbi:MAG: branched-chain amino acid ABC transporter permease [Thermoproteota archaeon]|nr:MAG: branched-chain amino acid ABC transporter permease [Candidatus Korarchaeota archaeon]